MAADPGSQTTTLPKTYARLVANADRVYVTPDIVRFSQFNPYLKILYGTLAAGCPELVSSGFFSPRWIVRRLGGEGSIYHHHWFECQNLPSFLNCLWKIAMTVLYRLSGGKVIWTIHNRRPHHGKWPRVNHLLRRTWARLPDVLHLHCASALPVMQQELGIDPDKCVIIPHPPFQQLSLKNEDILAVVRRLFPQATTDNKPVFLVFGYLAAYKGVLDTIRAFLASRCDGQLLIAGRIKDQNHSYVAALFELCATSSQVHLAPQFIPEHQLAALLIYCDYAVFNYRDILTSGGVQLALAYQKTIIAPRLGCLAELAPPAILFDDQEALADIFAGTGTS